MARKPKLQAHEHFDASTGRFRYRRTVNGKAYEVYSYTLRASDPWPADKRNVKDKRCLRDKAAELERKISAGLRPMGAVTVAELCERSLAIRDRTHRGNTLKSHNTAMRHIKGSDFGARRADSVTRTDAKAWVQSLEDSGLGYSSINCILGVLRPAYREAVRDGWLTLSPFEFALKDVVAVRCGARDAATRADVRRFLEWLKESPTWSEHYDGIYVLFHTGLRVAELSGLVPDDIDFANHCIHVRRQLFRLNRRAVVGETKTEKGARTVPMSKGVEDCLRHALETRPRPEREPVAVTDDGKHKVSGFVWLASRGALTYDSTWWKRLTGACDAYNREHPEAPIPRMTPHVARHTFCSYMAWRGCNPKTLQHIMGHNSIELTLGYYAHTEEADVIAEGRRLIGEIGEGEADPNSDPI